MLFIRSIGDTSVGIAAGCEIGGRDSFPDAGE
jgi:hypothetical protein